MQLTVNMMSGLVIAFAICTLQSVLFHPTVVDAAGIRTYASRMQEPENSKYVALMQGNVDAMEQFVETQQDILQEEDEVVAMLELLQAMADENHQSMPTTSAPSISSHPSSSTMPSTSPSISPRPSISTSPSSLPSVAESQMPSSTSTQTTESAVPTTDGGGGNTLPPFGGNFSPIAVGGIAPSFPSTAPSLSASPSTAPSPSPSVSFSPTNTPSAAPSGLPSVAPTEKPSSSPTLSECGITPEERNEAILAILDTVADPTSIRDSTTIQGQAANWLIDMDGFVACPDDPKLIQRFALAVVYFATNGNDWIQCSANPSATDFCGFEDPFVGDSRFLSAVDECQWAGISCDASMCVNEIEFELNNLVGTIPTEIALLKELRIWAMERGGLTGRIPTEIGLLTNLIFLDLDFNMLTGSLSSELLSLTTLTQLDVNDNLMTGSVEGIRVFPFMEFLQLHNNSFTGTIPDAVGSYSNLEAFTLHESYISGTMPPSVCNLLRNVSMGGVLDSLIADCGGLDPDIVCDCCTDCRP